MSPISPQAERRRRIITRAVPVVLIGAAAFVAGILVGSTPAYEESVKRFVEAWSRQDLTAMYSELTPEAAERVPSQRFARLYEEAERTATVTELDPGSPAGTTTVSGRRAVTVPVDVSTNAFGEVSGALALPVDGDRIAWEPHLVFPDLVPGEELDRSVQAPERGPILARDGTPLARGPDTARSSPLGGAAIQVAGEMGEPEGEEAAAQEQLGFPSGTLVGTSGLEKAFNTRLAGKPGGELRAVGGERERVLGTGTPVDGEPVEATIDPDLQEATVQALGGLFGGIAVLHAKRGEVLAVAGVAYSSPQPPGSTFKLVTTVAALESDAVKLDDTFPVESSTVVGGREIANSNDQPCGGTFEQAFANSCNTVFAPLGVEVGNRKLVDTAERFGFNAPPNLFNAEATAVVEPPESTIPRSIGDELALGVSAIGQGEVLATPLELATISQTIAAGGVRSPTPLVSEPDLGPEAEPVRVTSGEIAATVRDLMVGVVSGGTGTAAALPGVEVAGKTGTAELGPAPASPEGEGSEGEEPEQLLDAWFTAFAPAKNPRLAVAVMIVESEGDGGEIAAPIAGEVLSAGLD